MKGILLVNLGTPDSPRKRDVYRYLIEFLTDPKVIDYSWLKRQFLVRGVIVPARLRSSAASYSKIWTNEGSPLMVYSRRITQLLQQKKGANTPVELAMRYQNPSIEMGIKNLLKKRISELIVFPLFPQYASATTGSVKEKVADVLKKLAPELPSRTIPHFAHHPAFIKALASQADDWKNYDHVLFSYHGLPERQLKKADERCLTSKSCCDTNTQCYAAQCHATTKGVVASLQIPEGKYSTCFQSRLGKEPWLQPYASDTIKKLALAGHKKVLVFSPSFVCDCLETLYEIREEYGLEFNHAGGSELVLVPGLNDSPIWIDALYQIIVDFNKEADIRLY